MCFTDISFKILEIIRGTTVDGPGFRTSIYFAGCDHHCEGCHNPQSWDYDAGASMSLSGIMDIILEEDFDVTLTGGDPLYNRKLPILIDAVKSIGKNIWLYTGFVWEDIKRQPCLLKTVSNVDVVVDGPFIARLRDESLLFRGSSNQRLIDVRKSISSDSVVLYTPH